MKACRRDRLAWRGVRHSQSVFCGVAPWATALGQPAGTVKQSRRPGAPLMTTSRDRTLETRKPDTAGILCNQGTVGNFRGDATPRSLPAPYTVVCLQRLGTDEVRTIVAHELPARSFRERSRSAAPPPRPFRSGRQARGRVRPTLSVVRLRPLRRAVARPG